MAFPTGTWQIDANGFRGELSVPSVDGAGNLGPGSALTITNPAPEAPSPVVGFWDDVSKKITFIRVLDKSTPNRNQVYTGYLFDNHLDKPAVSTSTLTGSFEAFQGTGGVASRVLYGWMAQHRQVD